MDGNSPGVGDWAFRIGENSRLNATGTKRAVEIHTRWNWMTGGTENVDPGIYVPDSTDVWETWMDWVKLVMDSEQSEPSEETEVVVSEGEEAPLWEGLTRQPGFRQELLDLRTRLRLALREDGAGG